MTASRNSNGGVFCWGLLLIATVPRLVHGANPASVTGQSSLNAPRTPSRVCLVYTATSNASIPGPTLQSTQYVRQALDVDDVTVTLSLDHGLVGALQLALVADSTFATEPRVVVLKDLGPGGTAGQLLNITFTDSTTSRLPQNTAVVSLSGSVQPEEPLSSMAEGRSAYAGLGGSVGTWALVINDTWPQPERRPILVHSWVLRLCGSRMRAVDPEAAGAVPPNATANSQDQQQSWKGQVLEGPKLAQWVREYSDRVLVPLEISIADVRNHSILAISVKERVIQGLQDLHEALAGLPKQLSITETKTEEGRFKELLATFQLCHNDLYRCYLKLKDKKASFPVSQLDVEISRRYGERVKAQQDRYKKVEIQIRDAVEEMAKGFPQLSKRANITRNDYASALSKALTSELYGAAFGSASIAYFGAYLDAALGFLVYINRYQFALNPRIAVYRILTILQGVLGSVFFGLTEVPLFPQLVASPFNNVPVLVRTAVRAANSFRTSLDMMDQAMTSNTEALMQRRDYVATGLSDTIKQTSDAFEKQLAQSAPHLADLFGSLTDTVQGFADTAGVIRKEAQQALKDRAIARTDIRNQTRSALGTLTSITLDLVNSTSATVQEARSVLQSLVPGGQLPADVIAGARKQVSERVFRAQRDLQQLVPLADVQQIVDVFNKTVDGLLGQIANTAADIQGVVPGPAFFQAMDAVQAGLEGAKASVDGLFDTFETNYPGPLLNATLAAINARTQGVADDIAGVIAQARQSFPASDPAIVFRQLNASLENWWAEISDPISSLSKLVPPDQAAGVTQSYVDGLTPYVTSVASALGRAASDLSTMVTPAVNQDGPMRDTIEGLNGLVTSLNDRLFALNERADNTTIPTAAGAGAANTTTRATNTTGTALPARMRILSDQVSEALKGLLTQAPVSTTILKSINSGLQDVRAAIDVQRASEAAGGGPGAFRSAAKSVLQTVNETTQSWQEAVRAMDELGNLLGYLPEQVSQQLSGQFRSMRTSLVDRLADFNQRMTSFGLKWLDSTGQNTQMRAGQAFLSLREVINQGQQVAGQLAQRLEEGSQRMTLRLSNALPTNETLQAVRERMASLLGVPLDDLQEAIYNSTRQTADARPGPVGQAVNITAGLAQEAIKALNKRLEPVIQLLMKTTTTAGPGGVQPVPLLVLINVTLNNALERAASDWEGLLQGGRRWGARRSGQGLPGTLQTVDNAPDSGVTSSTPSRWEGFGLLSNRRAAGDPLAGIGQSLIDALASGIGATDKSRAGIPRWGAGRMAGGLIGALLNDTSHQSAGSDDNRAVNDSSFPALYNSSGFWAAHSGAAGDSTDGVSELLNTNSPSGASDGAEAPISSDVPASYNSESGIDLNRADGDATGAGLGGVGAAGVYGVGGEMYELTAASPGFVYGGPSPPDALYAPDEGQGLSDNGNVPGSSQALSDTGDVPGSSHVLKMWRALAERARQRIQAGLEPLMQILSSSSDATPPLASPPPPPPLEHSTISSSDDATPSLASPPPPPPLEDDTMNRSSAVQAVRSTWLAGRRMRAAQQALKDIATSRLPLLALPSLTSSANTVLSDRLKDASDRLQQLSVGLLFSPDPEELAPVLQGVKRVIDDYTAAQVGPLSDTPESSRLHRLFSGIRGATEPQGMEQAQLADPPGAEANTEAAEPGSGDALSGGVKGGISGSHAPGVDEAKGRSSSSEEQGVDTAEGSASEQHGVEAAKGMSQELGMAAAKGSTSASQEPGSGAAEESSMEPRVVKAEDPSPLGLLGQAAVSPEPPQAAGSMEPPADRMGTTPREEGEAKAEGDAAVMGGAGGEGASGPEAADTQDAAGTVAAEAAGSGLDGLGAEKAGTEGAAGSGSVKAAGADAAVLEQPPPVSVTVSSGPAESVPGDSAEGPGSASPEADGMSPVAGGPSEAGVAGSSNPGAETGVSGDEVGSGYLARQAVGRLVRFLRNAANGGPPAQVHWTR